MTSENGICEICGEKRAFFGETPEGQICRECDTWHCDKCMDWGKSDESGCICIPCGKVEEVSELMEMSSDKPRIPTWMNATPEQREIYISKNEKLVDHLSSIIIKHGGLNESEIISQCARTQNNLYFSPNDFFRILDDIEESEMTKEELLADKYCTQCKKVVKTWWELECCDMNPDGLVKEPKPHGNEIEGTTTCEGDYCDPRCPKIDDQDITTKYVTEHSVHERCCECSQFIES